MQLSQRADQEFVSYFPSHLYLYYWQFVFRLLHEHLSYLKGLGFVVIYY